jgi:glycosyltransferase involved in cell wall biosynthesis
MTDVTVVIPTRNRAELLATTLHSIQVAVDEARRAGWSARVLVIDDCSDDSATVDTVRAAGFDVIRIEEHDGRNNPASAIVLGVASAASTYVTLFGDDDIMRLAQGYDLVAGSYLRTDAALRTVREITLPEPSVGDLLAGSIAINDGAMVRTDLFQAGPWDASLDQQVIYPVWLTLLTDGARATSLTEPTWLYRRHDANISDAPVAEDGAQRAAVVAPFRAAYLDRGERVPASREQIRLDEVAAYAEENRRNAEAAAAAKAEAARLAREAWEATPWPRKTAVRIRRRVRRALSR